MSARSDDKDPFIHQDKARGMTRSNFEPHQVETSSVDTAEVVSKGRTCILTTKLISYNIDRVMKE